MNMYRGHKIKLIENDYARCYIYEDTGELVEHNKDRACGHCGAENTPEGHDGCLGELPNVMNACCGHGNPKLAYVQFWDKSGIYGEDAIYYINFLKYDTAYSEKNKR